MQGGNWPCRDAQTASELSNVSLAKTAIALICQWLLLGHVWTLPGKNFLSCKHWSGAATSPAC
jgi:hypothetical protein